MGSLPKVGRVVKNSFKKNSRREQPMTGIGKHPKMLYHNDADCSFANIDIVEARMTS